MPEVVFSAVLLALCLAVFMRTYTISGKAIHTARNQSAAVNFARREMEERRNLHFRDPLLNAGTSTATDALYRATIVVATVQTNIKSLTVSVPWTNFNGTATHTARFSTLICDAIH